MIDKDPNVLIFEDNLTWTKLYERLFKQYPQIAVTIITSFVEAAQFIAGLTEEQCVNTVAIVDGNLSPDEHTGSEGARIAAELKKRDIYTIGMSGSDYGVEGVDRNIGKGMNNAEKAVKAAVDKLMLGQN